MIFKGEKGFENVKMVIISFPIHVDSYFGWFFLKWSIYTCKLKQMFCFNRCCSSNIDYIGCLVRFTNFSIVVEKQTASFLDASLSCNVASCHWYVKFH